MKGIYLLHILESNYCKLLSVFMFAASYFLIPHAVFESEHAILGVIFMAVFALTGTCLIRNLKEKIFAAKVASSSIVGAIAALLGASALQVCTLNCTASFGAALLFAAIPAFMMNILISYAVPLILVSILLQIFALFRMGCLKTA